MRRVLLSCLLAMSLVLITGTQVWAAPGFGVGVKAGLNIAGLQELEAIDTVDALEDESKTGFIGGAFVKFPLGAFHLQLEGLYSVKGAEGTTKINAGTYGWEAKFTYLEVPLLLRYDLPTPLLKPFFYAGGSVSFLLEAEVFNARKDKDWQDIKDSTENVDYGLVVGAGIKVIGMTVEARYNHGLADVLGESVIEELTTRAKNRTWSVMVGLDLF